VTDPAFCKVICKKLSFIGHGVHEAKPVPAVGKLYAVETYVNFDLRAHSSRNSCDAMSRLRDNSFCKDVNDRRVDFLSLIRSWQHLYMWRA
jgi:hypothetical protein